MDGKDTAKERLRLITGFDETLQTEEVQPDKDDIGFPEKQENGIEMVEPVTRASKQWGKTPRYMLLKAALEEAGKPGLILQSEITRLLHELAGKTAACDVLVGENKGLRHLEGNLRKIIAEKDAEIQSSRNFVNVWRDSSHGHMKRAAHYFCELERFSVIIKNKLAEMQEAGK